MLNTEHLLQIPFVNSGGTTGIRKYFIADFAKKIKLLWDILYFGTFPRQFIILHDVVLKALFHLHNTLLKNIGGRQQRTPRMTEQEACELYSKI
jgi:hypothetical protein